MPSTTINGFKHFYEDLGSGEVLVMIHGANRSSKAFEQHWPELSQHFRVIAPDLRSMGQSEHVASLSPSAWVDDLVALLDLLGIEKAHVYGNSLGSRVAMRFAIEHPERLLSLILTGPHTYLTEELDAGQNRAGGDGSKLSQAERADLERIHGPDWQVAYKNYYDIRNQQDLQDYYNLRVSNPLMKVVGNFSESVSNIKCPILVVQNDNYSPARRGMYFHALELKEELPDQVKLAILPAFDNTFDRPLDRNGIPSDLLRRLIRDFVASVTSREELLALV